MNIDKELCYKEYIMREAESFHAPYRPEFAFYSAVKNGDIKKVKQMCENAFDQKSGLGMLSPNPLQNLKYHFVITTAMIARYCIEGGMPLETAYSLSDLYIQTADHLTSTSQITTLHTKMSLDYTNRMKKQQKEYIRSKPVTLCVSYIDNNLHKRIYIDDLAAHTGLHPNYLSRLFKRETGMTITDYIQDKKIETAKNMLQYSDYIPSQIASILAFSSQSYFIHVFHQKTGMTPMQYQNAFFHQS